MTMTKAAKPTARRAKSGGFAWKSGLLATSVGAVLMGWSLLARINTPAEVAAQAAAPQPRVIVVQVPISSPQTTGTAQLVHQPSQAAQVAQPAIQAIAAPPVQAPQLNLPAMPQKPVFQRPVTRTRRS